MNENDNVQCQFIYLKSQKNPPVDSIKGPPLFPISCACSNTHFIILNRDQYCFGFGMNKKKQIHKDLPDVVSIFTRFKVDQNFEVREISADQNFSAFILNNGSVVIHGEFNNTKNGVAIFQEYTAPRSIVARKGYLAFAESKENVILMSDNTVSKYKAKGYSIVKVQIGNDYLFALSANGILLYLSIEDDKDFKQITIDFPLLTIFSSANSLIISDFEDKLYEVSNYKKAKLSPITMPLFSSVVNAELTEGGNGSISHLVRLDANGFISLTAPTGRPLPGRKYQLPTFQVSCFSVKPLFIIVFSGTPILPIRAAPLKFHCCVNHKITLIDGHSKYNLITFDEATSFFSDKTAKKKDKINDEPHVYDTRDFATKFFTSPSSLAYLSENKNKIIYYTENERIICPDIDEENSFTYNLLPGDIVEAPSGAIATFIGIADGWVWLQPSKSRCVFSFINADQLKVINRPEHSIIEAIVDGSLAVFDTTPTFCCNFGYSCGDLVWFGRRGIVQFVGLFKNKFVFLDFSDFSLFSSKRMNFELLRTFNKNNSHSRFVKTYDGNIIELDVCCNGKIFLPTDRVSSKYGDATFLGTDTAGNAYIQTDEMKIKEIGAIKVNIKDLKLIRRIGIKAHKMIKLKNEKEISVNISTSDRVNTLMAADIIISDSIRCKVIGISDDGIIYASSLEDGTILQADKNSKLIYRPDILSSKNIDNVEVGSPAFDISILLPDDTVRINGKNNYKFIGIGKSGLYFVKTQTGEIIVTSYSPLVMSDSFEVISRTVYPLRK